jgi:hypothetical protein
VDVLKELAVVVGLGYGAVMLFGGGIHPDSGTYPVPPTTPTTSATFNPFLPNGAPVYHGTVPPGCETTTTIDWSKGVPPDVFKLGPCSGDGSDLGAP